MSISNELEAYAKGFKDGWEAARKESMPNRNHLQPHMWNDLKVDPPPGTYNKCPVCGAIGIRFEVCYNEKCPTRITVTNTMTTNKTDGFGVPYNQGAGAIGAPVNVGVGGVGTIAPARTVGAEGGFSGSGVWK